MSTRQVSHLNSVVIALEPFALAIGPSEGATLLYLEDRWVTYLPAAGPISDEVFRHDTFLAYRFGYLNSWPLRS